MSLLYPINIAEWRGVSCHLLARFPMAFLFTPEILMFAYMHDAGRIWLNR